jgi:hypothetical protein
MQPRSSSSSPGATASVPAKPNPFDDDEDEDEDEGEFEDLSTVDRLPYGLSSMAPDSNQVEDASPSHNKEEMDLFGEDASDDEMEQALFG